MKGLINLFLIFPVIAIGQGVITQVNCPNPFTANQIILVQSVHVNPFINAPAIVIGCYQMDTSFTIDNSTSPPTIRNTAGGGGTPAAILIGSGVPGGGTGNINDLYIDSTTGNLYKKTGSSTWTFQLSLLGPTGPQGATGSSAGTINFADEEVPSGTINSTNVNFTVAHAPLTGTLKLYRNGVRLQRGVDYTLSTLNITFLFTPQTGDSLLCDYRY